MLQFRTQTWFWVMPCFFLFLDLIWDLKVHQWNGIGWEACGESDLSQPWQDDTVANCETGCPSLTRPVSLSDRPGNVSSTFLFPIMCISRYMECSLVVFESLNLAVCVFVREQMYSTCCRRWKPLQGVAGSVLWDHVATLLSSPRGVWHICDRWIARCPGRSSASTLERFTVSMHIWTRQKECSDQCTTKA